MKYFLLIFVFAFATYTYAQQTTGSIVGKLTDREQNDEPLAFANILIKGTTLGTTSDFDGLYEIPNVEPGTYTLTFSFLGYETVEIPNIEVVSGKVTSIDVPMSASQGVALDEVVVTTVARKDSEIALLLDQKRAITLETSIGAQELARKGASDAATAVTKVTGISKEEGTGNVYVRGLGDRYNITTLNGLPLPSNNTAKKNIDLGLFGTSIIESIGIDKTYNAQNYGDFGGANINIVSRNYTGAGFLELGVSSGANSEAIGVEDFYLYEGPDFSGFYNKEIPNNPFNNTFDTSWDRESRSTPINSSLSLKGGDSFNIGENSILNFFAVGSFSNKNSYREGVNRGAPNLGTGLPNSDFDYQRYSYETATTLMGNVGLRLGTANDIKYNFVMLNNSEQKHEEFDGILDREDDAPNGGGFIQRNTFERTTLMINQLLGSHDLSENLELNWGVGYNNVQNLIPDRRQNILLPNSNNDPQGPKSFRLVSAASANHRFFQELTEDELAANISTSFKFKKNEDDAFDGKLTVGYNGRFKDVSFEATQFNYQILNVANQPTVDPYNIDAYFQEYGPGTGYWQIRTFRGTASTPGALDPQTYGGEQQINAGFLTLEYKFTPKFTLFAGARGEQIVQRIDWSTVIQGEGSNELETFEFLPSLALKYELNQKQNLRFAASKTYTLPQFKERAPFLFQEEINQDTQGNPALENSTNYNFDLRWELFPSSSELVSFAVFGKYIENPINTFLIVSAANNLSYANTGDSATAFGAELEVKLDVLENEKESAESMLVDRLSVGGNISYLNTNQELDYQKVSEETNFAAAFTNTEAPLQGASDFIFNADISYYTEFANNKNLRTTLAGNYFSDRIFALGSTGRGHLVDKGFVTLDFITAAQLGDHFGLGLNIRNLLNPLVERVNENAEGDLDTSNPAIPGFLENGPVTALSYKKGVDFSLSLTYKF
ncbi:TonB-dependent Receptor Plug Domain [Flagellimonas taeanensis]|jgi:outer membrane receptor protein involved in Fe transport|uniref:TonB-dependent Receptor Plug Domain n=1 Tax=Flagellimonas taeanensis TaxID=1005926 RepID=A0A1M6PI98_9FLAO|nr:TonB-dependent receptor [Allomuricauda taeanensis]SFB66921.1 TonB-dependent Receptor Plug Domain [Allomuricauda taeanensis]SHK07665.1 TonB-dependent Receptor Plug Domain [Allomuricauda taeanensis]